MAAVWPEFMARFPTPEAMAGASAGEVITAWGTLGYPRRARRLWEAAGQIAAAGWPEDLSDLPGVGRYTAEAVAAQVDGRDAPAIETNIRRVVERRAGRALSPVRSRRRQPRRRPPPHRPGPPPGPDGHRRRPLPPPGAPLPRVPPGTRLRHGRSAADPAAFGAPLGRRPRQAAYEGLLPPAPGPGPGPTPGGHPPVRRPDAAALAALVEDGLATLDGPLARLP